MKTLKYGIFGALFATLLLGCGTSQKSNSNTHITKQAQDTPEAFVPAQGIALDNASCKSPMIDPRDGTEILMVSAENGFGNYKVTPPKYGVQPGELLRLDCQTGKPIGIVKGGGN
ncbi:hypothetical protein KXJ69_04815 [Aureisphaera sp. CAU 1614]|uniref:Lipoprotein n=1 Tax=Halomarinibacterium sedimenti TaxID=2857106 RepID=A0A9X1JUZ3_9FLAO|nr:hypothetical protein [Halomarinibacterium sedimenti]MBW2937414.1 hypothetical protein [Halomarinibacterium sedimenti]